MSEITRRDNGPAGLVQQYQHDFAVVLPSHINASTWCRVAVGALRRDPKVAEAAANNPAAFLGALLDAARRGLEPGTEQYYLVPQKNKGRLEIRGNIGYQGVVELIYRAGAVSSVVVEAVRKGDKFRYVPGKDQRPVHEVDWFGGDRGELVGVYAYAVMKDGATSKVVILNKADIARAKASSQGASSAYSPWTNHEEAMWLKTAAHRLAKWVPTSAEYIREQLRAQAVVNAEQHGEQNGGPRPEAAGATKPQRPVEETGLEQAADQAAGDRFEPEEVEAEVVDETTGEVLGFDSDLPDVPAGEEPGW